MHIDLQLAELRMYKLSWAIRSKEEWQTKMKDPDIREKWKEHALAEQERFPLEERLTSNMINYVITELEGYSKIADQGRGIERGCFDAIWYSDRLISPDLFDALKRSVAELENGEKDWHPGSNGQVLDLVHPSLYPVVYAPPARGTGELDWTQEFTLSQSFVWIASDFAVRSDGSVRLVSPYINNLHPILHKALYPVIEQVLASFVPLFERVLGDSNTRDRTPVGYARPRRRVIQCIWGLDGIPYPETIPEGVDEELFYEEFQANAPKILPESHRAYKGALEKDFSPISLSGRTIQCIVKLANIHLTPEKPEYAGGSWHVEGRSSTFYYDEDNISESTLSFRVSTAAPAYHYQDDDMCMETLYNMERGGQCVQDLGSMITKQGRALAWPNLFQHRVSPFHLNDPTKPGHRKILAFFLVNPAKDPIVSATDVPPQQAEWMWNAMADTMVDPHSTTANLPPELYECIQEQLSETLMTRAEAEMYRQRLMSERTSFLVQHERTVIQQPFDMCEH
ncbi:hypothetical protein C8R44DRAFT_619495 [Mycena epipterygia]|nr:hypothetical protein C8R44DRAFT_619495 [Mycena epipterygia]